MRIISGSCRGRRLSTFSGKTIRPTPDRVREALFSSLLSRFGSLQGKKVLDLFAGTGAMGLEALSRGAEKALLIDQGRQSATIIPDNIRTCRLEGRAHYLHQEVSAALPAVARQGPFDLIFLDPPYGKELVPATLELIDRLGLLAEDGIVCAEAAREDDVPEKVGSLLRLDTRKYGLATLHLFATERK